MPDTGLKERDITTIKNILASFPEIGLVFIFGSRAIGNFKAGSDIDLAIMNPGVSESTISRLKSDLSESALPYFVDIINYPVLKQQELIEHINRVGLEFYRKL